MTMVIDPTLDDDRWGLFVRYKRQFRFEKNDYDVPESYFCRPGEEIRPNTIELVKRFLKQVRESRIASHLGGFIPIEVEELRQGACDIDRSVYARIVGAAECSIQKIGEETGHSYKLVKVERAVMTRALVMFLTLTAEEEEDGGPVPTIQAA
ncbi:RHO guanyl-nucleotide exchange factor 8, partial [Striga asiatica]